MDEAGNLCHTKWECKYQCDQTRLVWRNRMRR